MTLETYCQNPMRQRADFAQAIVELVPEGIVVTALNGTILYLNIEAERLFGYGRAELINQPVEVLLPQHLASRHVQLRESYAHSPVTRYMGTGRDLLGRRKDGSEFPVEIGLRTLTAGEEPVIAATIVDISLRKRLDTRIESLFASLDDASPQGKILVDSLGEIRLANVQMTELFGFKRQELIGRSMAMLLPDRYRSEYLQHIQNFANQPCAIGMDMGQDLTALHKNGTEIPIQIALSLVEGDKAPLVVAGITDITDRKRLELNLQQAHADLEEFTSVASHDLKAPLRGIADLLDWIMEDLGSAASPAVTKNVERIKVRIDRMERLTDDLLRHAQSSAGFKAVTLIDVDSLLQNIVELQPVPDNFRVTTNIQLPQIQAAQTPLETVLRNLFSNAVKHHDGLDPAINLDVEASGIYCLFTITDNGPGIPKAVQNRVFKLFQSLHNNAAGTGLGMSIARRLAASHGGRLELISRDGQRGCCFRVWWPRFAARQ